MRLRVVERCFALALLALAGALGVMQLIAGPGYRRAAEQNRVRLIPMRAVRGAILDRHGVPLAQDRLSFDAAIIPQEVQSLEALWVPLSGVLQRPAAQLQRAYQRGVTAPFAPTVVAQDVEPETAFAVEHRRFELPGVVIVPTPRREYPLRAAAGPVLGYLGLVNPEALKVLKPYGYTIRDWVGQGGVEQLHDAALRGVDGGLQVEVDHRGRLVRQLGLKVPVRGRDVMVTLDAALQQRCDQLLDGRRGAIVVMALDSGDIWAMVSSPGFDPGAFVDPDRDDEVRGYLASRRRPLFNRAVAGTVPPGSIFKLVTAYAGLASKKTSAATTYQCPGQFQLGRATFRCWYEPGHGPQALVDALTHSCNVFFYQWGLRVGPEAIAASARLFGFGQPWRIDLPGEPAGLVPDPSWKRARRGQPWYRGETANLAIGQGDLLVTPLQVLRMTATVALDGGPVPQPHLVKAIAGQPVTPPPMAPPAVDRRPLAVIRRGMEAVVESDTGTGRLARVPGVAVAGKTGTAQAGTQASHAWFCGYAPAAHPRMAVVVFVEHGGKGGVVAASIAGQIFEALEAAGALRGAAG